MSEPPKNSRPNIFYYAYKELSQDAMICWLLEWSDCRYRLQESALHDCGVQFVRALLKKHDVDSDSEISRIKEIKIYQQEQHIDVLACINDEHVLLIEGKTATKDRDKQLFRYYNNVIEGNTRVGDVANGHLYPIYLKTGNQSLADDRRIEDALTEARICRSQSENYRIFNRADFLDVLNSYEGCDPILVGFRQSLQGLEDNTNSYAEWTQGDRRDCWGAWEGFYRFLECKLSIDGWGYVPKGNFLGLWWWPSDRNDLYLQIEANPGNKVKLCFKVSTEADSREERSQLRDHWCDKILAAGGRQVVKPKRMGNGCHMTVAWWNDEEENWLAFDKDAKLNIFNTVENLKRAESVLKSAI